MSRSRRKIEIAAVTALVLALSSTGGVIAAVAQDAPAAPPTAPDVSPDNWIPAGQPSTAAVAPANWIPNSGTVLVATPDNWIP
jgi:hypothetical protein